MLPIKVVFQDEVRRVQVAKVECSFSFLQESIKKLFPTLQTSQFALIWMDDEGDKVTASSDVELGDAFQVMANGTGIPRFTVQVVSHKNGSVSDGFSGSQVNIGHNNAFDRVGGSSSRVAGRVGGRGHGRLNRFHFDSQSNRMHVPHETEASWATGTKQMDPLKRFVIFLCICCTFSDSFLNSTTCTSSSPLPSPLPSFPSIYHDLISNGPCTIQELHAISQKHKIVANYPASVSHEAQLKEQAQLDMRELIQCQAVKSTRRQTAQHASGLEASVQPEEGGVAIAPVAAGVRSASPPDSCDPAPVVSKQHAAESIVLKKKIDSSHTPSEAEVVEYALWLGMDLSTDQDLLWIAKLGLVTPLPADWKPCKQKDSEGVYYFNLSTGESTWDHPCDWQFKQMFEDHKKLAALEMEERQNQADQQEFATTSFPSL
jgi:centrosomal protein CEP164